MKNITLLLLAAVMLGLFSVSAHALSEQTGPVNSDGTAKFADPDERAPPFLVMPNEGSNQITSDPSQGNVDAPSLSNRIGTTGPGAQSFDRAFSHLQNQ